MLARRVARFTDFGEKLESHQGSTHTIILLAFPNLSGKLRPQIALNANTFWGIVMAAVPSQVAFVENAAWYIDVFQRTDNLFGFRADLFEEDEQSYLETTGRIKDGTLPADKVFPRMWIMEDFAEDSLGRQVLPHFTIAGNILVVSQQVADVFNQFDLGASTLHPVQMLKPDRKTPFPGTWYICQIAERKSAFEPEHSEGFQLPMFPSSTFLGSINLDINESPQIYLSQAALSGPNLWIDPRLVSLTLLISDELMTALRGAGVLGPLRALRCPVLPK